MKIEKLTQFGLGVIMCIIEYAIFITDVCIGKFSSTVFICLIYWTFWTIYFWNQRGKKCFLKIIPIKKDAIEIGDLIEENPHEVARLSDAVMYPYDTSKNISVCLVPGGAGYTKLAQPIQLVIVADDKLKLGDSYLNIQEKEIKLYSAGEILELTVLLGAIEDLYMKKVIMLQKDMPQEFIQSVMEGNTKDGDTVIVRKNIVFKERFFYKNNLILGGLLLFAGALLTDVFYSIFNIFVNDPHIVKVPELAKAITLVIGGCIISPIFYHAIKFILMHYTKNNKLIKSLFS